MVVALAILAVWFLYARIRMAQTQKLVAVADLELGTAFRELLTRSESERVVAEITEYLQREIVGPYLRAGISAVEAGGRIPHLARA